MAVKKEDCLDLPPLVRERVYVELSKPQRKLYDEMKRDFITFIGDQAVTASLAITKALRLMQIISGFAQAESDGGATVTVPIKDNPRAAALRELLQEIAPYHKVIVWAVFKRDYETISKVVEELSLDYVLVHGETSNKQETIERFQVDPKLRVLVGHPGAAGIGVNITAASYAIYYSRNFSLEQYLQSEARNYRGGSEIHEKITHIDIVAKDTLDEQVVEALSGKRTISVEVLKECLA